MDPRVKRCRDLTQEDHELLARIEAGMALTADVSRADIQLWCLLAPEQALAAKHTMPRSISSIYREESTGKLLRPDEHPQLFRALRTGVGSRNQPEIVSSGAPVMQDIYPIYNSEKRIVAALVMETNMIAHERQRRRNRFFRSAVLGIQEMCMRGELASAAEFSRFGLYDGVYLTDRSRFILYMSGIAVNLFRSIRIAVNLRNQNVGGLEDVDEELIDEAFERGLCREHRMETEDGRVWLRKVVPLRMPVTSLSVLRFRMPWFTIFARRRLGSGQNSDAVLVLMHNATESVQKERELNVKSALIQEVHHRVKNNLQNVAAILRMQARRSPSEETRLQLNEAVNRILSVSVIHEFLSEDEHRPINIRDLSQRIAQQVTQVTSGPDQVINIVVSGPSIRLPAGQATPVAMVLNELVLNAVEHGIAGSESGNQGKIVVVLRDLGDAVRMEILNNGRSLPADFDLAQTTSLGLQIVRTLVDDDLKGKLVIEPIAPAPLESAPPTVGDRVATAPAAPALLKEGTRAVVTFPKRSLRAD
ncbi:MAG: histidine kinase N-terminal domain-containing protein [Litorilinea sp.]